MVLICIAIIYQRSMFATFNSKNCTQHKLKILSTCNISCIIFLLQKCYKCCKGHLCNFFDVQGAGVEGVLMKSQSLLISLMVAAMSILTSDVTLTLN